MCEFHSADSSASAEKYIAATWIEMRPRACLGLTLQVRRDGLWLFTKNWLPSGEPSGIVFIVHGELAPFSLLREIHPYDDIQHKTGMGEYCERYEQVASTLTKQGLAVFSLDHQGHGKSGKQCSTASIVAPSVF
jgi:alpha-beta hydrolase superfamily lysophospholipase